MNYKTTDMKQVISFLLAVLVVNALQAQTTLGTSTFPTATGTTSATFVGIKSTAASGYKLSMQGALKLWGTGNSTNGVNFSPTILFDNKTASTGKKYFLQSSNEGLFRIVDSTALGEVNRLIINNAGFIGIGTSAPTTNFHIAGGFRLVDGTQGVGKVLSSDANGLASWVTPSGGAITSIFGRTGVVVSAANDYTFAQIGSKPTTLAGYGITDAALALHTHTVDILSNVTITSPVNGQILTYNSATSKWVNQTFAAGAITSVFGRTGIVTAAANDYTFAQIGSKPTTLAGYGITDGAPLTGGTGYIQNTTTQQANSNLYVSGNVYGNVLAAGNKILISRSDAGGIPNTLPGSIIYDTGDNFQFRNQGNGLANLTVAGVQGTSGLDGIFFPGYGTVHSTALNFYIDGNLNLGNGGIQSTTINGTNGNLRTANVDFSHTGYNAIKNFSSGFYGGFTINPDNDASVPFVVKGSTDNNLLLTHVATNRVGIGTATPQAKLDVTGNIKIADGTQGAGKVLTSDANGLASWVTPAGGGGSSQWTTAGSDIFYNTGNVGIGTNAPTRKLHVEGTVHINSSTTVQTPIIFDHNTTYGGATDGVLIRGFYGAGGTGPWHQPLAVMSPNMNIGERTFISFGKASSVFNRGSVGFYYNGAGSANNHIALGFYGVENILTVKAGGNVQIGTNGIDAGYKLDVNGTARLNNSLVVNTDGTVAIGTVTTYPTGGYKLAVAGGIISEKVKVKLQSAGWPDYVFQSGYKLLSLPEIEKFIKINNHLPDVPSSAEVEKNGIDLGDNQAILLKKIEELTLHMIDMNKRLDKLSEENELLKKKINK